MKNRIVLLALAFSLACTQRTPPPPAPTTTTSATSPRITFPDGFVVHVEVVADDETRKQGLMFRDHLADDRGMIFFFPESGEYPFWMKDTLIPLSIAFYSADGRILKILDMEPCDADPCPLYDPEVAYRGALEVNQGAFADWGISAGDRLRITSP